MNRGLHGLPGMASLQRGRQSRGARTEAVFGRLHHKEMIAMFLKRVVLFFASAVLIGVPIAKAELIFFANLTVDQEVGATTPANPALLPFTAGPGAPDPDALRPLSFGTATLILNPAMTALSMTATIFNIDVTGAQTPGTHDNLVNAHIHAPAPPGAAVGVVWGFVGAPDHHPALRDTVITPFADQVGGIITSTWTFPEGNAGTNLGEQLPNIFAGLAYLNFHTVQFAGGEIRGQILQVREPGMLALLALALGGVYLTSRRRTA
jgi:hypothetical protein